MADDDESADELFTKADTTQHDTPKDTPKQPNPEIIVDQPAKQQTTKQDEEKSALMESPENKEEQAIHVQKETLPDMPMDALEAAKSEPHLAKTGSTDAVESAAAKELQDDDESTARKLKRSIFANEGRWTGLWLTFTATVNIHSIPICSI